MKRPELYPHLERIKSILKEIEQHVPESKKDAIEFRADLAGLLTIIITSSYEECVKKIIIAYADKYHPQFSEYVERKYYQINSRIKYEDLCEYCKFFKKDGDKFFKERFNKRQSFFVKRYQKKISDEYAKLLKWRNDFAHTGVRQVTIVDVKPAHEYAQHTLFAFYDTLLLSPPNEP